MKQTLIEHIAMTVLGAAVTIMDIVTGANVGITIMGGVITLIGAYLIYDDLKKSK